MPETTTATVGSGYRERKDVPEQVGEFTVWDCPNDSTVKYTRTFYPHDDVDFPRLKEKVGITHVSDEHGWDVTRSVVYEESGSHSNVRTGEKHSTVVQDTQCHRCMAHGIDTFKEALSFATTLIEGLSQNGKPQDVSPTKNPIHSLFTDVAMEQYDD